MRRASGGRTHDRKSGETGAGGRERGPSGSGRSWPLPDLKSLPCVNASPPPDYRRLTSPTCYFGSPKVGLEAARVVNDDMAAQHKRYPDRIRFMASIPWEHAKLAVAELKRACDLGAVGVMVMANINGKSLTDRQFAP